EVIAHLESAVGNALRGVPRISEGEAPAEPSASQRDAKPLAGGQERSDATPGTRNKRRAKHPNGVPESAVGNALRGVPRISEGEAPAEPSASQRDAKPLAGGQERSDATPGTRNKRRAKHPNGVPESAVGNA